MVHILQKKEINLSNEKMSIWPQNKNHKFRYRKCFWGQMPIFLYERFNSFFRIHDLSFEEDIKQKKSGYHSSKNRYLTHKTLSEVFPIDGMVAKWKLKKQKRYSSWNLLLHIILELHVNRLKFCYMKRCNEPSIKEYL